MSLKKNFIYNFIVQILNIIVPLITAPYLSRVLHETGNGQYSYSMSIITYFVLFASLGFAIYGQREVAKVRDDKEKLSKVFWEITFLKVLSTLISLGVLYSFVFTIGFGNPYNQIILILSTLVITNIFDIAFFYQGIEDFKSLAIRSIFIKLVGLICIFVFVKNESDLWVYALSNGLIMLISAIIMWCGVRKKIGFVNFNKLELKKHIKPTIMIFLPSLAVTFYSVFDKTMIGLLSKNPDYENGCYEQAYKINSLALIFVTIISSILAPRNSHEYYNGNIEGMKNNIKLSIKYVWMIGTPLILGFAALSTNLSTWFFGEGYFEVPLLMQIMSVRFIFSGLSVILSDQLFIVIGKEKYTTIATFCAALINGILNFILIPYLGATGAAITTAVSEGLVFFVLLIIAIRQKFLSIQDFVKPSIKYVIASLVMFSIIYLMQYYLEYAIWTFILITLVGAIIYFLSLLLLRDSFFIEMFKKGFSMLKRKKQ